MEAMAHAAVPTADGQTVPPTGVDATQPPATPLAEPQLLTSSQAQIDPATVLPLLAQMQQAALVAVPPPQIAAASAGGDFGPSPAAVDAATGAGPSDSGEAAPRGGPVPPRAAASVPAAPETGGDQPAPRFQTAESTAPQASGRAAVPPPSGSQRLGAVTAQVARTRVEPGAALTPAPMARIAPEGGATSGVMAMTNQFSISAETPVGTPTTGIGSPAAASTTPTPGIRTEPLASQATGFPQSPAAPAKAPANTAGGSEPHGQAMSTDPSHLDMAQAQTPPEATDPRLTAVARTPSSTGVATASFAPTAPAEADDALPALDAGQTSRAESVDPGSSAQRLVAVSEFTARTGQLRSGDPALPAQAAAPTPTSAQAIPQPNHPISSFAAQLADQAKPETGAAPGTVAGVASAGKELAGTPIAEAATPARMSDGLAGSEFRPETGAALATTAPQRAAAALQDLAAPSHPRAAPPHPATTQVAVSVARAVDDGVDRIAIKLQPPELGRIDVRLDFGADGRVQAMVLADRPATLEILRNDARELERALAGAGLETASGGLSFGLRQQANGNGQGGAQGFPVQPGRHPSDDAVPEEGPVPVPTHVRPSATGRLDIQV
jgi:flagellar hook-length control protein FliK